LKLIKMDDYSPSNGGWVENKLDFFPFMNITNPIKTLLVLNFLSNRNTILYIFQFVNEYAHIHIYIFAN